MGEHKKLKIIKGEIEMNQNFMTLNGSQATKLINFLNQKGELSGFFKVSKIL